MADTQKHKKGKNFGPEEEKQLCRSFLTISQESAAGTGQKPIAFWERIMEHYNLNRPAGSGPRPWRSLETKWATIKGDVAKFNENYAQVEALQESGNSDEDKLRKALDLYRIKSAKNAAFSFLHCWEILKNIPKWATYREVDKAKSLKRKSIGSEISTPCASVGEDASSRSPAVKQPLVSFKLAARPTGAKCPKDEGRLAAQKESALKAQAKATSELAVATFERNTILRDRAALALFTIPATDLLQEDAREYLALRRAEELQLLRARLAAKKPVVTTTPATILAPTPTTVPVETPVSTLSVPVSTSSDPISLSSAAAWIEEGILDSEIRQDLERVITSTGQV